MPRAVWLLALLMAGCVQPEPTAPDASADGEGGVVTAPSSTFTVGPPPDHPVGRAWTYRGTFQYVPETELTVVVAAVDGDGYLFAGAAPKDVVYDALWGDPRLGRHDRALNRIDFEREWFSFPLYDGKSWKYSETLTLTARRAPVETPNGTDDGFVVEGSNEIVARRWDYSPALGVMVRHVATLTGGTVLEDHALVGVAEGSPWVWYQTGTLTVVPGPHAPAVFEVADGFDAVILSAGGGRGGRVEVRGPGGESWSGAFEGDEEWRHGVLAPTAGRWAASVVGQPFVDGVSALPVGWGHVNVAPVRWLPGQP